MICDEETCFIPQSDKSVVKKEQPAENKEEQQENQKIEWKLIDLKN